MSNTFDSLKRPTLTGIGSLAPSRVSGLTIEGDKLNTGMLNLIGYAPLSIGSDTDIPPYDYEYPLFRNKGRNELMGGISISTIFHDCIVGKTDLKSNDHFKDQTGSLLLHNKGRETQLNNNTLGLEVYYGSRIFHKKNDPTSPLDKGIFTYSKIYTNEKHRYEYKLDNNDLTHSNTYVDKIKLHSDTNTIITNGGNNSLELQNIDENSKIQIKSFNNVINMNKERIELRTNDGSGGSYIKLDNNNIDIYGEIVNISTQDSNYSLIQGNNRELNLGINDNNYIKMESKQDSEVNTIKNNNLIMNNDKLQVNSDHLIHFRNTSGCQNEIKLDHFQNSLELQNFKDSSGTFGNQIILDSNGTSTIESASTIESGANTSQKQIKMNTTIISALAKNVIEMTTPMVEISNKLNVKEELIIGDRQGIHYRITSNKNNGDTSLVIHKYKSYTEMEGIVCEFDL